MYSVSQKVNGPTYILPSFRTYIVCVMSQHCWQITLKYNFVVEKCVLKQFLYLWKGILCEMYFVFMFKTKTEQIPISLQSLQMI